MLIRSLLGAAALAAVAVGPLLAQDITLRAVANSNTEDEDYDGLIVFKDFVEKASNGAIAVELFIGTQLCANGTECYQAVEDGSVDIYITTSGGVANIHPYIQVLDLPYVMTSDRVAEAVLSGPFTRALRDRILADSDGRVRLMTIGNTGGWRSFANTRREVRGPDDLAGLKLRTVPADLPQELVRALGAAPTPIPWPELFTSLQTGVVEGTANGITDIMNMKFPDAGLKYLTLDEHAYMGALWIMNNEVFTGMSPELRRVVVDGFAALQQATFASPKRKSIKAYEDFAAAGGRVYVPSPAEKAALRDRAAPVYDWFRKSVEGGSEFLDLLLAEAQKAEAALAAEYETDVN